MFCVWIHIHMYMCIYKHIIMLLEKQQKWRYSNTAVMHAQKLEIHQKNLTGKYTVVTEEIWWLWATIVGSQQIQAQE